MTEHVEIRAPLADVRIALTCKECGVEIVANPGHEKQRTAEATRRLACPVCGMDIDGGATKALWHVAQAVEIIRQHRVPVSVVLRRDEAPRTSGLKEQR